MDESLSTVTQHLETMGESLSTLKSHFNQLEATFDEHTALLTQILARLPKEP
jgi:hypothetical protein